MMGVIFGCRWWGSKGVTKRGLYLHGTVGTGKTFLMDLFYNHAPVQQKSRMHFHSFMSASLLAPWLLSWSPSCIVTCSIHAYRQAGRHLFVADSGINRKLAGLMCTSGFINMEELTMQSRRWPCSCSNKHICCVWMNWRVSDSNLMDSLSLGNDLQQNICQQSLVTTSVMEFVVFG